jgi:hypothetical protein
MIIYLRYTKVHRLSSKPLKKAINETFLHVYSENDGPNTAVNRFPPLLDTHTVTALATIKTDELLRKFAYYSN